MHQRPRRERLIAARERQEFRDIVADAARGDFVLPSRWAAAYALRHDREATLRWLDSMRIERDPMIPNVALNPLYDWLRDDPGYARGTPSCPGVTPARRRYRTRRPRPGNSQHAPWPTVHINLKLPRGRREIAHQQW